VFQKKFDKTLISVVLAFTMLASALAASYVTPTRAQPNFTLWATIGPDPYWGYYGGYWDIWYSLQPEWAKIGVDLQLYFQGDIYSNWELIWSSSVPEGGWPGGKPPHAWDLTMMEWWLQPQGMLWQDGIILAKNIINGPMGGWNIFPYLSQKSDEYYWGMQTSFDVDTRKAYADAWQVELMHNPPIINIYSPHVYEVHGSYMQGYDPYCFETQPSHIRINRTLVDSLHNQGLLSDTAYTRLYNDKTLVAGAAEAWWSYLNPWCDSYTEESFMALMHVPLYFFDIVPWPAEGEVVDASTYAITPRLASDMPQDIGWETDQDGEDVFRVRIPLRQGVLWSDGHEFDAQDVVWTLNDIVLYHPEGTSATGDTAPIIKRAEYIGNYTPGDPNYNPYAVDLILHDHYVDLPLILANDWGPGIMPYHYFGGVAPSSTDPVVTSFDKAKLVPVLGPFKLDSEGTPAGNSWIKLARNPLYFGYDLGWGPYDIDYWIFEYVPDASTRLSKLLLHELDYAGYPTAPVEVFEELIGQPDLTVIKTFYPAVNPIWMNFNNPQLSNRYVRLALAHAIPYADIYKDILPSWGITDPVPGGSFIHPWQYYQGVQLFNTEMGQYTYNITRAQQYLNMWFYAQTGEDYTNGPVGDADFSGIVDLDDLWYWLEEYGNAPYTRPITWLDPSWYTTYPWPADSGPIAPGNDIDPDFDNSGTVGIEDYPLWLANFGREYPFPGAW